MIKCLWYLLLLLKRLWSCLSFCVVRICCGVTTLIITAVILVTLPITLINDEWNLNIHYMIQFSNSNMIKYICESLNGVFILIHICVLKYLHVIIAIWGRLWYLIWHLLVMFVLYLPFPKTIYINKIPNLRLTFKQNNSDSDCVGTYFFDSVTDIPLVYYCYIPFEDIIYIFNFKNKIHTNPIYE